MAEAMATARVIEANGIRLSVTEAGEGPAVVLCHGFPELAYSWRHQLPALAAAGFRAIAPDQRGYGGSARPEAVEAYDIHHLTGDLVGLLDALGLERAVFVGHDWGGIVVWMMALLHPGRTAGVVGVNTPYLPRPPAPPVTLFRARWGEHYYVVHFQRPGEAEAAFARDVRRVFTQLMRAAVPLADAAASWRAPEGRIRTMVEFVEGPEAPGRPLLTGNELGVYVDAFTRAGFAGGVNWYRNLDRNWETTPQLDGARIDVPSLMVTAELDPVLRPAMAEPMRALVSDLEVVTIPGCGHWTQQEKPAELNRILIDWLGRRFGAR
jgi:pimeloyl-ACP methyl ester carboxylesterase